MATRNIVKGYDATLRKKCREVAVFDARLHQLLDDMLETMNAADGAGLAAPQVGVLRRVCIVDAGDGVVELINPVITGVSEEMQCGPEGCLSFPGEYSKVERPMRVSVRAQDRHGDLTEYTGEGLKARAFCHEIDHLNGILFHDIELGPVDDEEEE